MGSTAIKSIITIAVLFLAVVMAYGLVATAPAPRQVEPEATATLIRVTEVTPRAVQLRVRSQGTVEPEIKSALIPEVSGRVKWVSSSLVAGGYFEANQTLIRIDDSDYRSALERARATHARAIAEEDHARFELSRRQKLVDQNLASQSDLESSRRTHRVAEAVLKDARVALDQARRDLLRTEIKAPYTGLVRSKSVDLGQYVQRGTAIAQIYASDSVEIRLPIADSQLAFLDVPLGQRGEIPEYHQAQVAISSQYGGQQYEWQGRLVRLEADIDAQTRMVNAVARIPNNVVTPLKVGLFVQAEIYGRQVDDVVILPRVALRNRHQVLVVDDDSRLRFRDVDILRFDGENIFVQAGLQAGDRVNLSPLQTVVDGMRVRTADAENPGD